MTDRGEDKAGGDTVDAFHRGRFYLAQPAGRGHRAGLDAMLLAAAVPQNFDGRLADLGAGAGGAGLAVASRCGKAQVTLVEIDAFMADYARRTLTLPQNARLSARCAVLMADARLSGRGRAAAGLADNAYDCVIMNPPFNPPAGKASPDPLRRVAHVMPHGEFESWVRSAAAILRPGGMLAVIARPEMLQEMLDAFQGRFGALELKAIHPRANRPAIRLVLRGVSGSRKPLAILPPLVLHEMMGRNFTVESERLINGEAGLFEA